MADVILPGPAAADEPDTLGRIASAHGSPFYLADTARLRANLQDLLDAFRRFYPRCAIAYSYKTNYLPAFIRCAHERGAYAEVVSRMELDLARRLGVPADRIIFNGPVKTADDLEQALAAGVTVNVDSPGEARLVAALAGRAGRTVAVGVRCHLGDETPRSRFGVDLGSADGRDVIEVLDAARHVRLGGLHCHHSGERTAARYRARTRRLISLHADVLGGRPLATLNVGGGFSSRMSEALAAELPAAPSSFDEYAEAVAGEMAGAYGDDGPRLMIEPGMGVLADTMTLVTRVEAVKRLHGRRLAVVDGSIFNIKPLGGGINLPIRVIPAREGARRAPLAGPVDVVGHTCMEIDVLHTAYGGAIAEGDWVAIDNVGAYSNVLNAPFIRGTPPIVALDRTGPPRLLRRASTLDDLLATYRVDP